jgi:hypothetical protein
MLKYGHDLLLDGAGDLEKSFREDGGAFKAVVYQARDIAEHVRAAA